VMSTLDSYYKVTATWVYLNSSTEARRSYEPTLAELERLLPNVAGNLTAMDQVLRGLLTARPTARLLGISNLQMVWARVHGDVQNAIFLLNSMLDGLRRKEDKIRDEDTLHSDAVRVSTIATVSSLVTTVVAASTPWTIALGAASTILHGVQVFAHAHALSLTSAEIASLRQLQGDAEKTLKDAKDQKDTLNDFAYEIHSLLQVTVSQADSGPVLALPASSS